MSISCLVRGAPLRASNDAPTSISNAIMTTCTTMLSALLRADRAPESLNMRRLITMVVTKAATSIGRNKFHLQILNSRLREIEDAQNSFVIQTVIGGQKQHALLRGPARQDLSHSHGQFGRGDLLIAQYHATIRRKSLSRRGLDDAAGCRGDEQDQP